jgi:predicted HTH transcriptional regulator
MGGDMSDTRTSEKRRPDARLIALIEDLRALPAEISWVEFKHNNADPKMIGKLIAALSNAARLANQHFAYVLWGIRDVDHAVIGTDFEPAAQKESG